MSRTINRVQTFTDAHKGRAGHINIQHYAALIEAARCDAVGGQAAGRAIHVIEEKVRFAAELHPGDTATLTGELYCRTDRGWFVGAVVRDADDAIVARFWQSLGPPGQDLIPQGQEDEVPLTDLRDIDVGITDGSVFASFSDQLPADEWVPAQYLWYIMTEALWSVQYQLGASPDFLREHHLGGGAAVFQLFHHHALTPGSACHVRTRVIGISDSSVRYQHDIYAGDEQLAVSARYILAYFDRRTGERCAIPEPVRRAIGAA